MITVPASAVNAPYRLLVVGLFVHKRRAAAARRRLARAEFAHHQVTLLARHGVHPRHTGGGGGGPGLRGAAAVGALCGALLGVLLASGGVTILPAHGAAGTVVAATLAGATLVTALARVLDLLDRVPVPWPDYVERGRRFDGAVLFIETGTETQAEAARAILQDGGGEAIAMFAAEARAGDRAHGTDGNPEDHHDDRDDHGDQEDGGQRLRPRRGPREPYPTLLHH